ncbi:MAG: hypothetical protein KBG28_19500 [Kofleriaceae bacterium]|jgi:protein ImuB|nr:hypothetical protein [Kofleriaceae bacterium]MBP6835767.1 hypothetical protein [Kofleriaceae bacterium]MBP9206167.1 hypothetical protein [Kofleriaceae bacterium]
MRLACVDLPALPLQLVWRDQPDWRRVPVVVVDDDRPTGTVLWACERARASRVLPGQRYAHALGLCPGLRAHPLAPAALRAASEVVRAALHRVAPRVERAWHDDRPDQPTGSFWLDGDGLDRLYPDRPEQPAGTCWGRAIATTIAELGLVGAVVVGHSRFATFALARAMRGGDSSGQGGRGADRRLAVYGTDADERAAARAVPLARLELAPELRDALARLGVFTLGQLVQLPGGGILERWGKDAHQLYQLAAGERWDPLVPEPPPSSPDERVLLDDEEHAAEGLMFALKPALDRLLDRLARRGRAVAALHLELTLRRSVHDVYRRSDCIKPASATLDGRSLLRLIRLRLDGQPPAHGAIALRVWADDTPASAEQLSLFAQRPRRDLRAASEAVARLRAELGDAAVVRAVLREGHLPEARFGWEPIAAVPAPRADAGPGADERPLVRRLLARPRLLPPQSPHVRDDGWLLSGLEHGAVVRLDGPYLVSGGWWAHELHREYHFAETRRGDCLWVFFDRERRRWFQHGAVE